MDDTTPPSPDPKLQQRVFPNCFPVPDEAAGRLVIDVLKIVEPAVNAAMREGATRMTLRYVNIVDVDHNPDGQLGHVHMVAYRDTPDLVPTTDNPHADDKLPWRAELPPEVVLAALTIRTHATRNGWGDQWECGKLAPVARVEYLMAEAQRLAVNLCEAAQRRRKAEEHAIKLQARLDGAEIKHDRLMKEAAQHDTIIADLQHEIEQCQLVREDLETGYRAEAERARGFEKQLAEAGFAVTAKDKEIHVRGVALGELRTRYENLKARRNHILWIRSSKSEPEPEPKPKKVMPDIETQANRIYTAYCKAVGGVAFNGNPLPDWKDFSGDPTKAKQANAWREAARASLGLED
jgi:hypothetical protein